MKENRTQSMRNDIKMAAEKPSNCVGSTGVSLGSVKERVEEPTEEMGSFEAGRYWQEGYGTVLVPKVMIR